MLDFLLIDFLPTFGILFLVNTILVELLTRAIAKIATVNLETRLATACALVIGAYLVLLPDHTGLDLLLIFLGSTVAGALFIWSRYRRAKRRVLERRREKM